MYSMDSFMTSEFMSSSNLRGSKNDSFIRGLLKEERRKSYFSSQRSDSKNLSSSFRAQKVATPTPKLNEINSELFPLLFSDLEFTLKRRSSSLCSPYVKKVRISKRLLKKRLHKSYPNLGSLEQTGNAKANTNRNNIPMKH